MGFAVPSLNLVSIFKVFSDHHTHVAHKDKMTSFSKQVSRIYPDIDFPKITALIGFDLLIVIKV